MATLFSPETRMMRMNRDGSPTDMGEAPPKAVWSMFSPPPHLTAGVAASLTPQGAPSDPPPRRKKSSVLRKAASEASKENDPSNVIDQMLSPWKSVEDVEEEEQELVLQSNSESKLMAPSPLLVFLMEQPAWLQALAKALLCLNDQMFPLQQKP